ncbi:MAG: cell division protein FtsQ/DivIB [Vicinamibacterales bacterium]
MAVSAPTDKRFRRAHVSPTRHGRRLFVSRKGVVYAGLLSMCLVYAGYRVVAPMLSSEMLTVTRITVTGNTRLSRGEVLSLLYGLEGRNMLFVDLDEWRQKLLASPWVADAALRLVLPGAIDVVVSERQPIGIGRVGDALYLIDGAGGIIDEFGPHHADLDLPVISGLSSARNQRTAGPTVDESRAALAARLLASLQERPDLAARISEVDVSNSRDAVVTLEGDATMIRLGDDQFVERLQSYLDLAPALRDRVSRMDYVDLRFGERVYVRPTSGRVREP